MCLTVSFCILISSTYGQNPLITYCELLFGREARGRLSGNQHVSLKYQWPMSFVVLTNFFHLLLDVSL